MAEDFIQDGQDVFIISTKPYFSKKNTQQNFEDNIYYLRSFFSYLKYYPKFLRAFYHFWNLFNPINYNRVKSILKREKPDMIITHNLLGVGFSIATLIKKLNIKHTHCLHDIQIIHPSGLLIFGQEQKINSIFCKIYISLTKKIFSQVNYVISPSKWLLNLHLEKGFFSKAEKKIDQTIEYNNQIKKVDNKFNKFVYVGQIEKHKGILFLIELFNDLLKNQTKEYQLDIIGDGAELKNAKTLAEKNSRINFLGHLDNETVCDKLASYDGLIVPSLCYENSPSVIHEANHRDLLVIASDIGGIPETINPNNSYLFEPNNKKALIEIIKKLS